MLTVKLNGIPLVGRIDGLESFTLNYSRDSETARTQKSYTNELSFYDDGFNIIYPLIVSNPNGLNQSINVEVWDDCCNAIVYNNLIIRGDMVDYCSNDCFVTCRLTRQDPDEVIYQCLLKNEISDNRNGYFNYNFQQNGSKFPLVTYCNELRPNWLMAVILSYALFSIWISIFFIPLIIPLIQAIVLSILGICAVLKVIETILNAIPGVNVDVTPGVCDQLFQNPFYLIKEAKDFVDRIIENIVGCGRKHPSPLYRQYVDNACQICGINNFNSSILNNTNSPYYNALYFFAPAVAGSRSPTSIIRRNRPTMKMSAWLDTVAKDFNARWWISNGNLYFERKDFFLSQPFIYDAVANADTGDILKGICFTYNEGKLFSSIIIKAQMDMLDDVGNEDMVRYRRSIDYGNNVNWEGRDERQLSYACARFRNDGIEPDILTQFNSLPFANFLFLGNLTQYSNALLMSKGTCAVPKMLIWDGRNNEDATIVSFNGIRNQPAMVNSGQTDLYDNFYSIDNPNQNPFRFWNATLTVRANCTLLQQLDVNRTVQLRTPYGAVVNARINNITANLGERTIQFNCEF